MLHTATNKDAKRNESKEGSESDGDKTQRPRLRHHDRPFPPRDKADDEVSSVDLDSEDEYSSPPPNSPKSRIPSESPNAKTTLHVPEFTDQLKLKDKSHKAPPPHPSEMPATDLRGSESKQGRMQEHTNKSTRVRAATVVLGVRPKVSIADKETQQLISEILKEYSKGNLDQNDPSTSDDSNYAVHGKPLQPPTPPHLIQPSKRRMGPPPAPPISSANSSEAPLSSLSPIAFRNPDKAQLSIPVSALPPARSLSEGAERAAEGNSR
jgi:hypothetical protein